MFKRALLSLFLLLSATPAFAQVKISGLPAATTPLVGSELTVIVQGGVTKQSTATAVANSLTTLTGSITGIYTLAGTPTLGAGLTATGQTITGGTFSGITLTGTTVLPGSGAISSSGFLGIGMSPTNAIDIADNNAGPANVQISNGSGNVAAYAQFSLANLNGPLGGIVLYGSGFTTAGTNRQNGVQVVGAGAGGLTLQTNTAQPLYFVVNNTEVARFDTSDYLQLSTSSGFSANGVVNTALTGVGPAGSHTTVQEWLTVKDSAGTIRYIPAF